MAITRTQLFPVEGQSPIVLHNVPQSVELVGDVTGDKGTNEVWDDTKRIEDFEVKITTLDEYSTGVPHKVIKRVDTLNESTGAWTEGTQETYEASEKTFNLSYKGHERDFEVKVVEGGDGGSDSYYKVTADDVSEFEEGTKYMAVLKDSLTLYTEVSAHEGAYAPYGYTVYYSEIIPSCIPNYGGKSCVTLDEYTENTHLYYSEGVDCEIEEVITVSALICPPPSPEYLNSDYIIQQEDSDPYYEFISEDSNMSISYVPSEDCFIYSPIFYAFPKDWCQYLFDSNTAWYYVDADGESTGVRVGSSDSGSSSPKVQIRYRWGMNDSHDLSVEKDITITERPRPVEPEEGGGDSEGVKSFNLKVLSGSYSPYTDEVLDLTGAFMKNGRYQIYYHDVGDGWDFWDYLDVSRLGDLEDWLKDTYYNFDAEDDWYICTDEVFVTEGSKAYVVYGTEENKYYINDDSTRVDL